MLIAGCFFFIVLHLRHAYLLPKSETKRKLLLIRAVTFVIPEGEAGTFFLESPHPIQDLYEVGMDVRRLAIGRPNQIGRFHKTRE